MILIKSEEEMVEGNTGTKMTEDTRMGLVDSENMFNYTLVMRREAQ